MMFQSTICVENPNTKIIDIQKRQINKYIDTDRQKLQMDIQTDRQYPQCLTDRQTDPPTDRLSCVKIMV